MSEALKSRLIAAAHGDGGSQWPRNPDGAEAWAEIERLEEACTEWSEVSQRNYQRAKVAEAEVERLRDSLDTALGHLLNAEIDLRTGAPKQTAINTIRGGIKRIRAALKGCNDE